MIHRILLLLLLLAGGLSASSVAPITEPSIYKANGDVSASQMVTAASLDNNFGLFRARFNSLLVALKSIQRDDNTLADKCVKLYALAPEVVSVLGSVGGWQPKAAVSCATTANITLSGEQTIDGVTTSASRVLVKNQTTASQNGIYVSGAGAWMRATDADTATEIGYAAVTTTGGTTQGGTSWVCTTGPPAITLDTTALTFALFGNPAANVASTVTAAGTTTARLLSERFAESYNVKDFGAVGDGATDDTAAVQAAITAAQTTTGLDFWTDTYRKVYLPPGSYLVTGVDITYPIALIGAGSHQTVLALKSGANRSLIKFIAPVNTTIPTTGGKAGLFHPIVEGIALNCNGAAQSATSDGIEVLATLHALATRYDVGPKIRDVVINSARDYGIFIGANRGMGFIERCVVRYNGTAAVYSNAYDWRVTDSDFGTTTAGPGWQQGAGGATSFTGCYFYTNSTHGLVCNALCNSPCHAENCSFDDNGQSGAWFDCGTDENVAHSVLGSRFYENSAAATGTYADVYVQNCPGGVTVSACSFIKGATRSQYLAKLNASTDLILWSANTYATTAGSQPWATGITNRAERLLPERLNVTYNVRLFGAIGDGSTDDSVAIQAALTAAHAANGGRVFVPPGAYIASDLVIYSNTTLYGVAPGAVSVTDTTGSILKEKASTSAPLLSSNAWHNSLTTPDSSIVIENLSLNGNRYNSATGDILVLSTTHAVVRNCVIGYGGGHGVHIAAKNKTGGDLTYTGVNDLERCTIVYASKNGVYGEDSTTHTLADLLIRGCSIGICGDAGSSYANVLSDRGAGTLITNSNIYQAAYRNIDLGSAGGAITNNVIEDGADSVAAGTYIGTRISPASGLGISITGNYFVNSRSTTVGGVTYEHLFLALPAGASSSVINGNTFASATIATTAHDFSGGTSSTRVVVANNSYTPTNVSAAVATWVNCATPTLMQVNSNDFATWANDWWLAPINSNGSFGGGVRPSGSGAFSAFRVLNGSDPDNSAGFSVESSTSWVSVRSVNTGTGTIVPMRFQMGSSDFLDVDTSRNATWLGGYFAVDTAGKGLQVKEGSNCKQGTATLAAGTVTVANTSVTASSRILLTSNADGGTPGWLRVSARTASTSFTITSSSGTDTSTVAYEIFEPAP